MKSLHFKDCHAILSGFATAVALCAITAGCEENKLCRENSDCEVVCRAYAANNIFYACQNDACKCLAKEERSCTGEATETKCAEICTLYAPDKTPVCRDNLCDCIAQDETQTEAQENAPTDEIDNDASSPTP